MRYAPPASLLSGNDTPRAKIDLSAAVANAGFFAKAAKGAEIAPVVKCDGYGLGATPISAALYENAGSRSFFVAHAGEGEELRKALPADVEIFILNGLGDNAGFLRDKELTPVLNSIDEARQWAGAYPNVPALMHFDTGMNRLGEDAGAAETIAAIDGLNITIVMSHLACGADRDSTMNAVQLTAFRNLAKHFPKARKSLAASAGALLGPEYAFDMVRLGISLYGAGPFDKPEAGLQTVANLTAPVMQLREAEPGETVGYGATATLTRKTRLATIAYGYGDGYPRAGANGAYALLGGAPCPLIGRVSMDLIVLDITDAPGPIAVGDRAEFFGGQIAVEDAAAACQTFSYELLTGLGPRVERLYV